jgi:hypothetical protein
MLDMDVSILFPFQVNILVNSRLIFLTESNPPRCGIYRYSDRNSMVHASVPP